MHDTLTINPKEIAERVVPFQVRGRVIRVVGNLIQANLPNGRVGELCKLKSTSGDELLTAEIIGFGPDGALLTPIGELKNLSSSTIVIPTGESFRVPVSSDLLGRVVDHSGMPIDGKRVIVNRLQSSEINISPPDPMKRALITDPLITGIRTIDGLMTVGEGQRVAVFGGPGCGKSTLLSQIIQSADVDIVIVGLIGERGREVREFVDENLGVDKKDNKVVVVATSNQPALERAKAAYTATTYAEYFCGLGKRVLLVIDSITRFVRALREIGLAAGEPSVRGGFPPSVFSEIPRILERPGRFPSGSITAVYSVLAEGDVMKDIVCEEVKAIVDGHVTLSPELAAAGLFPAIDILNSRSRVMPKVVTQQHLSLANEFRQLVSKYHDIEFLLQVGEYKRGTDLLADRAIDKKVELDRFRQQTTDQSCTFEETLEWLSRITN